MEFTGSSPKNSKTKKKKKIQSQVIVHFQWIDSYVFTHKPVRTCHPICTNLPTQGGGERYCQYVCLRKGYHKRNALSVVSNEWADLYGLSRYFTQCIVFTSLQHTGILFQMKSSIDREYCICS